MSATRGPLLYSNPGHPFDRLPLTITDQVGATGAGGITWVFDHFTEWFGPIAEGTLNGWTLSGATGVSTVTSRAVEHGIIRLAASTSANANAMLQFTDFTLLYESGSRLWFFTRIALSDANDMEAFVGISTTNTDFIAGLPADGLFFEKAETATDWDFHVRQNSTETEDTTAFSVTLADDTFHTLGILVNAAGTVTPYYSADSATFTAGTGQASTVATMPDSSVDVMTPHWGIEGGASSPNDYMDLDWFFVAKER